MKRILFSTLLILATISAAFADEISFVASAPKSVEVGKRFNLAYEINSKTDSQPVISEIDGMRILTGPHSSYFTQTSNINGKRSTTQTITYTYIVAIDKEGTVTIPGASVMVDGKKYTSNPVTIKVLPANQTPAEPQQQNTGSAADITNDRLFILASVNKTKVYDQEALLLTYKVYTDVNLTNLDNPVPELKGFNIQEVELSQSRQFELEHYKGHNYNTLLWRQFVLFPQQTGKLEIPAMDYEAVVAVQARQSMDPFEMMFNGGPSYVEVRKKLKSNKIVIDVEKLPAGKPADFSGAVGNFTINSTISTDKLKSNEDFTLKVTVKGDGNMKLMGDPVIDFPSEFEVMDPIVTDKYKLTNKGFAGEKVYEYVVTPRTAGIYSLPTAKLTYFDTTEGQYKTAESQEYTIDVEKGASRAQVPGNMYVPKEDGKILATDIRYIKLGDTGNMEKNGFYASTLYYLLYIIPLAGFVVFVILYRKHIKANSNVTLVKTRKANSVAVRRLKKAKVLLQDNRKNEFYDEVLKAVWGYMSDKLNMPLSQLSKENISSELARRGCDEHVVGELLSLLNEGEFARYAPGDANETMDKVYKMAIDVIGKMENSIKK